MAFSLFISIPFPQFSYLSFKMVAPFFSKGEIMADDMDFYIRTEYNQYDGFNHLVLRFDGIEERYTKKEFIEGTIKALNRDWIRIINYFLKKGNLPKKRKSTRKNFHYSSLKWKIFRRDNFTCQICGNQEFLELDHIIPISKGGKEEENNYQTLCKKCNVSKKDKV